MLDSGYDSLDNVDQTSAGPHRHQSSTLQYSPSHTPFLVKDILRIDVQTQHNHSYNNNEQRIRTMSTYDFLQSNTSFHHTRATTTSGSPASAAALHMHSISMAPHPHNNASYTDYDLYPDLMASVPHGYLPSSASSTATVLVPPYGNVPAHPVATAATANGNATNGGHLRAPYAAASFEYAQHNGQHQMHTHPHHHHMHSMQYHNLHHHHHHEHYALQVAAAAAAASSQSSAASASFELADQQAGNPFQQQHAHQDDTELGNKSSHEQQQLSYQQHLPLHHQHPDGSATATTLPYSANVPGRCYSQFSTDMDASMQAPHQTQLPNYNTNIAAESISESPCRSLDDSTSIKYDSSDLTAAADSSLLLASPTTPTTQATLAANDALQYRDLDQSTNTTTTTPTSCSIAEQIVDGENF